MKKEAVKKEVVFTPSRWMVHISVSNPKTGKPLLVSRHECRDRHHAATLLSEIRELAEDLAEFLPGLSAEGYELSEAALALPAFVEAVADGTVNLEEEAYWRIGLAKDEPVSEA